MSLKHHYKINNYLMLEFAEDKLNEIEISKNKKLLKKVLLQEAMKTSRLLLNECSISVIHVQECLIDKDYLINLHFRRKFCYCVGAFMLTVIGTKNHLPSIIRKGVTLSKIDNIDMKNMSIRSFESFLCATRSVTVSIVQYYLPCCTYKNCS